jgi:hypothetical protein
MKKAYKGRGGFEGPYSFHCVRRNITPSTLFRERHVTAESRLLATFTAIYIFGSLDTCPQLNLESPRFADFIDHVRNFTNSRFVFRAGLHWAPIIPSILGLAPLETEKKEGSCWHEDGCTKNVELTYKFPPCQFSDFFPFWGFKEEAKLH